MCTPRRHTPHVPARPAYGSPPDESDSLPLGDILVVDDTRQEMQMLAQLLTTAGYQVHTVSSGELALDAVWAHPPELMLLDLSMPGMDGYEVCRRVKAMKEHQEIPLIFISATTDIPERVRGFHLGAVDFIFKPFQDAELLARVSTHLELSRLRRRLARQMLELQLVNAQLVAEIERRKASEQKLRELSLHDYLTGLYNRHGFMTMAERQLRIARRTLQPLLLVFLDIDGLKQINDLHSHQHGDRAIRATATLLRQTFRNSDIIARLGGDEFALLLIDSVAFTPETFAQHLHQSLATFNARNSASAMALSLSWGAVRYLPPAACSLAQLIATADRLMYQQKNAKGGAHAKADSSGV
jgi:diguanylate cyclase (GGDEF)-like protein